VKNGVYTEGSSFDINPYPAIYRAYCYAHVCAFFLCHIAHNCQALRSDAAARIPNNPPAKHNRGHNRPKTNDLRAKYNQNSGKALAELLVVAAAVRANLSEPTPIARRLLSQKDRDHRRIKLFLTFS
jgi:hypothetical protein